MVLDLYRASFAVIHGKDSLEKMSEKDGGRIQGRIHGKTVSDGSEGAVIQSVSMKIQKISDHLKDLRKFFKSRPSRKLYLKSFRNDEERID